MSNKAKKPFSLVNLRSIKELSKKQQETIAKEEEMMEDVEEKEKRVSKAAPCADLPKPDYDAVLGYARQDGKLADPMTAKKYIDYLLGKPREKEET